MSHLLFADDLLLFTKATISQVRVVNITISEFCRTSGVKVNFTESELVCSKEVPRLRQRSIRNISNIQFTCWLDKYLGVPLIRGRVGRHDFNFITDKLSQKLSS